MTKTLLFIYGFFATALTVVGQGDSLSFSLEEEKEVGGYLYKITFEKEVSDVFLLIEGNPELSIKTPADFEYFFDLSYKQGQLMQEWRIPGSRSELNFMVKESFSIRNISVNKSSVKEKYANEMVTKYLFDFLLLGGLFVLGAISFVIFLRRKNALFFFYALYTVSAFFLVFSKFLITQKLLVTEQFLTDFHLYFRVPEVFQMLGLWAYIFFVCSLLDLDKSKPKVDAFLKYLAHAMLIWGVMEVVVLLTSKDEQLYERLIAISSSILFPVFIGVVFWIGFKVKNSLTRYILASNVIFIGVLFMGFLRTTVFKEANIPYYLDFIFQLPFATFLEAIVFGLAIAAKISENNTAIIASEKKLASMEMNVLRSQINPHFIFNSMNSIRSLILVNDTKNAESYLMRFSKLLRKVLNNSREERVTLEEEIETLKLYVNIEKSRFTDEFEFDLDIDDSIPLEMYEVPPLILQPFVENAFIHGLKESTKTSKVLQVRVEESDDEVLILIRDNGVGRNHKAKKTERKSFGTKITQERMALFNTVNAGKMSFEIIDEIDGTSVQVKIKA